MTDFKILIIDDHSLIIEGYKSILQEFTSHGKIEIIVADNSEQAFRIITTKTGSPFRLVFLDLNLPEFLEENIKSGEDLAQIIKKNLPDSKLVILTSHAEAFRLYNIVKKINPSGLLVKSDFTNKEFLFAIAQILDGNTYYSSTVKQAIKKMSSHDGYLDNYNRQIITLLSQGIKTKNLPDYLPLSISAIDKRKVQIKEYLNIEKGNDEDIIRLARLLGFI